MKALLSFAALAVTALALGLPAKAQDSTSGSSSTSSSGSTSSSSSGSRSGASTTSGASSNQQQQRTNQRVNSTTNNTIPITLNAGTGSGGGGAGTNGTNATDPAGLNGANGNSGGGGSTTGPPGGAPFYSQSDVTIRTTPTVYAPPVSGGNPCTLAVSGGVSVIGWGAAAGGTFVDQDCADRQAIAMVHNAGYPAEAREMMCNNKAFYMAARSVGKPCVARQQFDGPGAPPSIVRQQPQELAPPPQQQVIKDRTNLPRCSRTVTDNCFAG